MVAFVCSIMMNIITTYYSGLSQSNHLPNWVPFIAGVLYLAYHILDCCDGKQARRLKVGSPLGFFMDHNLDSFSLILITISSINIMKVDNLLISLVVYLMTTFSFFFATWEEFHTGVMDLPAFNGVDEGAFTMAGLFFFTSFVGTSFWTNTIYGIQLNNLLACSFLVLCAYYSGVR